MINQQNDFDMYMMAATPGQNENEGDVALAPAKPKLKRPAAL
jgi:hypothetical protein